MRRIAVLGMLMALPGAGYGETLAVTGATLIDGTGRAPVEDAALVIEGSTIVYAGAAAGARIPSSARVIDARGKFVVPGFADMHNHLYDGTFALGRPPSDQAKNLRCLLARGITTVFDPTVELDTFVELKRLSRENLAEYPNFFGAGSFAAQGGHGAREGNAPAHTEATARERVRTYKSAGVDAIKVYFTDLSYVTKRPQPMLETNILAAIIDEAHRNGLKAYVHAPILRYAKQALASGADGLMHGIVSDPVDAELIALMKRNGAVYVTTHSIFYASADLRAWAERLIRSERSGLIPTELIGVGAQPATVATWERRWDNLAWLREHLAVLRANARTLADSGVLMAAGSDTSNSGAGIFLGLSSQVELELLAEAGIAPERILRMTGMDAVRMLGRQADLGSLEPGKLADVVILDADPLADVRNVRRVQAVIKAGRLHAREEFSGCSLGWAGVPRTSRRAPANAPDSKT